MIGSRWVFRTKLKVNLSLDKYKSKVVTKGILVKIDIDYIETFNPIVTPTTIRVVLTLTLSQRWIIK